jgi:hypothetical protein
MPQQRFDAGAEAGVFGNQLLQKLIDLKLI